MTRDSRLWWLMMAGALLTGISSRMDLLDPLLPAAHTDKVHAVIELACYVIGITSGVMTTSPLDISRRGRIRENANAEAKSAAKREAWLARLDKIPDGK